MVSRVIYLTGAPRPYSCSSWARLNLTLTILGGLSKCAGKMMMSSSKASGCSRGDLLRKVPLPVGGAKKRNIILLTIWCILRWYIVTFDKTKQLWAYPMSKTNLHHFLFMSVTLTFWVLRPFWALKSDLASVIALQLQHFVCQTFWYIKIRNPSTNKKVIPQNVKWYRFPKGLLC